MGRAQAFLAAERLAEELLDRCGCGAAVPVDIGQLARALRVSVVVQDQHGDGWLVREGDQATAYVASTQSRQRMRFTIAHELAHWAIAERRLRSDSAAEAARGFRSEEAVCNRVAGALLVPRTWLEANKGTEPVGLDGLRRLALHADVSLPAMTVRCNEILGEHLILLQLRRPAATWRWVGQVGTESDILLPTDDVRHVLAAASAQGNRTTPVAIPLMRRGSIRLFHAEVLATPGHASVLLRM